MLSNGHAGCGGRVRETGRSKYRYRALARPYPSGSVAPPGRGRQADRKESRIPWREQDAQEANAGGRKAAGKRGVVPVLQPVLPRITGRIPGLVPGPKEADVGR